MPGNDGTGMLLCGTLLSRLLGFARDLLTAALLGPGADAFLAAFRLPNIFRRLLAEGSLGLSLAAEAGRITALQGPDAARAFSQRLALRLFAAGLLLALFLALAARPLLGLLAPGLAPATAGEALLFLRCCLPYLPLCLFSAPAFAFAASQGDFRAQALAPALINAAMIPAACFALAAVPGNALAASLLLCAGLLAGAAGQAVAAVYCLGGFRAMGRILSDARATLGRGLRRAGKLFWEKPADPEASFLRRLPSAVLGAAPHQAHVLAGLFFASLAAPGCISALYFAERLIELPLGLAGAAPGQALLPGMARAAAAGDGVGCGRELARAVRLGAFFSLPATAGLYALAGPLSALLFGHGAFEGEGAGLTAAALGGYALGLPALCASRPLLSALHALGAASLTRTAALVSLAPLALLGCAGVMADVPLRQSALLGLGLAAGAWCNLGLLLLGLGRTSPEALHQLTDIRGPLAGYCALSLFMAVALSFFSGGAAALSALIALCAAVWLGLHRLCGNRDAAFFFNLFKK